MKFHDHRYFGPVSRESGRKSVHNLVAKVGIEGTQLSFRVPSRLQSTPNFVVSVASRSRDIKGSITFPN